MSFDIKKIRSLMARIDESYEDFDNIEGGKQSVEPEGEIGGDDGEQLTSEPGVDVQTKKERTKMAGLVGDDRLFKTWEFLKDEYDDSKFDLFFSLTLQAGDYFKLANNIHKAIVNNSGEYTVDLGYKNIVKGTSKFFLPRDMASNSITFFDAIYIFSFLDRNGTSNADKRSGGKGYLEDEPWANLSKLGYGNVNEVVSLNYDSMISLISEFKGFPILQGYMKEIYHRTKAGEVKVNGTRELRSLRNILKNTILEYCPNIIQTVHGCSRKVYKNQQLNVTYIPYLDGIYGNRDESEKLAISVLEEMRISIEGKNPYELRDGLSDYDFWKKWAEENSVIPENDVITASGLDSVTDEILNRLRVLINRDSAANQPIDIETDKWGGNLDARDRRANVIVPSYDVAEKLGIDLGVIISQEDIEEMKSNTLDDWLKLQRERANSTQEPANKLRARGPFSMESIEKLLNILKESGLDSDDDRKEANAYDFFKSYSLATKDSKAENRLLSACQKAIGGDWAKFENTAKMRILRKDLIPYLDKLKNDKSLGKLSLDMLTYRDTKDGLRNFVAVEYQGEHHYRPNATASISIDDLYNAHFRQAANGDVTSWPGYWKVMTAIINASNGWGNQAQISEAQDATYKTDRKGFLNSCITTLELAINGKDGGKLKKIVHDECDGYTFDDGYEDSFEDWVRKDRPRYKQKPIKSSISHFADSYYRWWCELDTFIQSANDLAKFEKTNTSLFTVENGKKVGKCGLFYVCPNNQRVIPIEVIGNAISNPYRAAFFSDQLSQVGINISTITEVYNRTFRANKGKEINIKECISVADGKTRLIDAINGTLQ